MLTAVVAIVALGVGSAAGYVVGVRVGIRNRSSSNKTTQQNNTVDGHQAGRDIHISGS